MAAWIRDVVLMKTLLIVVIAAGCGGSQKSATPPPNLPVSMEQARTAALAAVPGQIAKEELDPQDNGRWVYEFEIKPSAAGAPTQDVDVDATTGAVQIEAD